MSLFVDYKFGNSLGTYVYGYKRMMNKQ